MFADTEEEIEAIRSLSRQSMCSTWTRNFAPWEGPKDEPLAGSNAAAKKYAVSVIIDWDAFCDYTDERISEAAQKLLFSSDCEGKWSWKECRDIQGSLRLLKSIPSDTTTARQCLAAKMRSFNMHEQFMGMMRHCWKRRVNPMVVVVEAKMMPA